VTGPYLQGISTRIKRHAAGIITMLNGSMLMHCTSLASMCVIAVVTAVQMSTTVGVGMMVRITAAVQIAV